MNLKNIHTDRLTLIPMTLEITKSLINGSSKEIENLGIKCDDELIYWEFIKSNIK